MNRFEAHENLVGAVKAAYTAGLEPWEVQQALACGSRDAGKLAQADIADRRAGRDKDGVLDEDEALGPAIVDVDDDDSVELCSECEGKLCADCREMVS